MKAAVLSIVAGTMMLPGADKVHLATKQSEVADCTAVGNIRLPRDAQGQTDLVNADTEFRNQTVGLGGNTAFVTSSLLGEGIAYRCP